MKLITAIPTLLLLSMFTACAAHNVEAPTSVRPNKESSFSIYKRKELIFRVYKGNAVYKNGDPNIRFAPLLLPGELEFVRAAKGDKVSLDTAIVMPPFTKGGVLRIEFSRLDVHDEFIQSLFLRKDAKILKIHSFARKGIEAILTDERLVLNIHAGVKLHLRDDVRSMPEFKTFKNLNVTGEITNVSGKIYYSNDQIMTRIKLRDFFDESWGGLYKLARGGKYHRNRDSSEIPVEVAKFPKNYPPRVVEGP